MPKPSPLKLTGALLGTLAAIAGPTSSQDIKLGDPLHKCVVATYRICAHAKRPARAINCYLFLPEDEPGQEVKGLEFIPKPTAIIRDKHGRRIAHFFIPKLPAGGHVAVRWIARVKVSSLKLLVGEKYFSPKIKADARTRELYLADGPQYGCTTPHIKNLAQKIIGPEKSPLVQVRLISTWLGKNLTYEMTGGWSTAPTTLKRGTGSCSEYTFSFISLCRACGIPARYVGATICRRVRGCSFDGPHHRWAEAFLPGYGWAQIDVLRRDCIGKDHFRTRNRRLVLVHGDGGEKPMGWRYSGAATAKGGARKYEEIFWCDGVPQKTYKQILAAAATGKVPPLADLGKGLCLPFLTDRLWDRDRAVVLGAAEAICRIDGNCARDIRYRARGNKTARQAMAQGLLAVAPQGKRGAPGTWTDLYVQDRILTGPKGPKPFRNKGGWLGNNGKTGTMTFGYTTGDRYLIDLLCKHTGDGKAALVFAANGTKRSLRLPLHTAARRHIMRNYLMGTSTKCRRGLYGISNNRLHRVLIAVDGYRVQFMLDGKKIFSQIDPAPAPGRIGLTVWGKKTNLAVKRLRVYEIPNDKKLKTILADKKLLELKGWPPPRSL